MSLNRDVLGIIGSFLQTDAERCKMLRVWRATDTHRIRWIKGAIENAMDELRNYWTRSDFDFEQSYVCGNDMRRCIDLFKLFPVSVVFLTELRGTIDILNRSWPEDAFQMDNAELAVWCMPDDWCIPDERHWNYRSY